MPKRIEPAGESEFSADRSGGRRSTTSRPGRPQEPTVTPLVAGGLEYRGTIASDTLAQAVESQAHLLSRPPTAPLPRKPARRAQ